jgi:hypothetical protein
MSVGRDINEPWAIRRSDANAAVIASRHLDPDVAVDGHRDDGSFVIVDLPTDQVDAARRAEEPRAGRDTCVFVNVVRN